MNGMKGSAVGGNFFVKHGYVTVGILALLVTTPVHAQMFSNLAGQRAMNNLIMANVNQRGQINAHREANGQDQKTVSAQPQNLNYSPSKNLRQKNMTKFLADIQKSDPKFAASLQELNAQGDLIDLIDREIRPVGLSANNVADAYTVWWITAWEAVHGREVNPSSSMVANVKQQVEQSIASSSAFGQMNGEQKQTLAEVFLVQTLMIEAAKGSPSLQAELPKAVNQGAQKMGLDLTTMDLTEQGFVPRSGKRSDAGDVVEGAVPGEASSALAANDVEGNAGADAGQSNASKSDTGKLALYGVGGAALLAGVFALGKSFGGKG